VVYCRTKEFLRLGKNFLCSQEQKLLNLVTSNLRLRRRPDIQNQIRDHVNYAIRSGLDLPYGTFGSARGPRLKVTIFFLFRNTLFFDRKKLEISINFAFVFPLSPSSFTQSQSVNSYPIHLLQYIIQFSSLKKCPDISYSNYGDF